MTTTACAQGLHRLCNGQGNAADRPFEEAEQPFHCDCLCHGERRDDDDRGEDQVRDLA